MSQKVDGISNSLSELESEIDAVNLSLAEMKKSLNSIANKEIDSLLAVSYTHLTLPTILLV